MSNIVENLVEQPYRHGFVTDVEADVLPKGLSEEVISPHFGPEGGAGVHARR
jgi:hypothetical protein